MSRIAQSKFSTEGKKLLAPFVFVVTVCLILPFVIWPSLLMRAGSADFMPHRYCYLNDAGLIWVNVVSDAVIGIAYIAISTTLAYLVNRNRGAIPFSWMFVAFGLFIVACGFTHIMEVVTVWRPLYWLAADVKIVTAVASVVTAFALPVVVPKITARAVSEREQAVARDQLEQTNVGLRRTEELSAELAGRLSNEIAFWDRDLLDSNIRWWGDIQKVFDLEPQDVPLLNSVAGLFRFIHPDDHARVGEELTRAIRNSTDLDTEFRIVTPSGKTRWIMSRGTPIYAGGKAVRMVGVYMNVTARRVADAAMQRAEKLALTGRMAATIAHEINNPLAAVTNLNYLISHDPEAKENVRELAALSMHELDRIAHIVRSTLALHRGSGGAARLNLGELVDSALALYESQLRNKQVQIRRVYGAPMFIVGVAPDLRQVFANLVSNAADALNAGGRICIRIVPQAKCARVDVSDSGQGIERSHLERLFEPFFTTKGERGTGLGLWVSSGIVQKHGGTINVHSRCGGRIHGTRFTVCLPLSRDAAS